MKEIFTIIAFSYGLLLMPANAQPCAPDTNFKSSGYYPEQIAVAKVGIPYEAVIQFRLPKDTNVIFFGQTVNALIDSMEILKVVGVPNEFTYACGNTTCTFYPEQTGCGKLSGTPLSSSAGINPLEFHVRVYARVGFINVTQDDTIRQYQLEVQRGAGLENPVSEISIYPNPGKDRLFITYGDDLQGGILTLTDLRGRIILTQEINANAEFDVSQLPAGLYFISLQEGSRLRQWKWVKE